MHSPLARSALGSPERGAGSPNGLTEGVYYNEWYMPMVLNSHCWGRQFGDPKLTLQSVLLNGTRQRFLSSWLPPGGSCHDEISASRNRYFVVTDEGWRWLKVSTAVRCFVETKANAIHLTAYIYQPVATPHQAFLSTGSEVPFDKKSSFPPGEAKGAVAGAGSIQRSALFHLQMGGCAARVAQDFGLCGADWVLDKFPRMEYTRFITS